MVEIDIKQSEENAKGVLFPLLLKELLVHGVGLQCRYRIGFVNVKGYQIYLKPSL